MTISPLSALPYPVGTLLKGSGAGVFRVADRGLQHIFDWETFLAFNFKEEDIVLVEDIILSRWSEYSELTRIIQDEAGEIYWVVDGNRWAIERWQDALATLDPSPVDETLLARLPLTQAGEDLPPGTLLAADSDRAPIYYLFSEGVLRRFVDRDLLIAYGYQAADVIHVPDPVLLTYDGGPVLTALIQSLETEEIFLLEAGQRRSMPVGDDLWALGYGVEDISKVPIAFVEKFPLLIETIEETPVMTCDTDVADFFVELWTDNVGLSLQTGCPLDPAQTIAAAWQPFEGGDLLWRAR